ncbi:MAG: hypothetical protein AAF636_04695 [Pseudomonadota bacterium]
MRNLLFLLILLWPAHSVAQETPIVTVDLAETETILGQPLIVRIKVLVPTFSPSPPEFPTLEAPGLIIRLPERASGPISEQLNGETWSGVQRSYRVYPLRPGAFEIPVQTVRVAYANPGGIEPVAVDLETEAIRFDVTVPAGATDLSPLIIANDFTLTQVLEVPDKFSVGDAIVRTVEASISGTSPILIPQLIARDDPNALRGYPKDPKVTDSEDRGILSGSRNETVSYLGVAPGDAVLPEISFDWFNLQTGMVETAQVDGARITVARAAAPELTNQQRTALLLKIALAIAIACALLYGLYPFLKNTATVLQARWKSSEHYAARQVQAALNTRDLQKTYDKLQRWQQHVPGVPASALDDALTQIGKQKFGAIEAGTTTAAWSALSDQFTALRRTYRAERRRRNALTALPKMN